MHNHGGRFAEFGGMLCIFFQQLKKRCFQWFIKNCSCSWGLHRNWCIQTKSPGFSVNVAWNPARNLFLTTNDTMVATAHHHWTKHACRQICAWILQLAVCAWNLVIPCASSFWRQVTQWLLEETCQVTQWPQVTQWRCWKNLSAFQRQKESKSANGKKKKKSKNCKFWRRSEAELAILNVLVKKPAIFFFHEDRGVRGLANGLRHKK